jgi:hypothetical protein
LEIVSIDEGIEIDSSDEHSHNAESPTTEIRALRANVKSEIIFSLSPSGWFASKNELAMWLR